MAKSKLLCDVVDKHPAEQKAFGFLGSNLDETWLTWAELRNRALAIASWIQSEIPEKAPVVLLFEPNIDFAAAYLACLYTGNPAVPAAVPKTLSQGQPPELLGKIVESCGAKGLLTTDLLSTALPLIQGLFKTLKLEVKAGVVSEVIQRGSTGFKATKIEPSDLAMIQYTSGSTATPNGVKITQAQLSYMLEMGIKVTECSRISRGVIWLPHTHNTGLLSILMGFWAQFPSLCMSPVTFVSRPVVWLQAISRHKATVSGAPNFAWDLCMKMISEEDKAGLDLSSWHAAYSGGEALSADSLHAFADRFSSVGFSPLAYIPMYGLSEATLLLTGSRSGNFPRVEMVNGRNIVSCGKAVDQLDLAIVNPETLKATLPAQIGEIWASGPGISEGYVGNKEGNAQTFGFALEGHAGKFLRTGDLGLVKDQELYVVGRIKEVFILQGRKFHAADLEGSLKEAMPELRLAPFLLVVVKDAKRETIHLLVEAPQSLIPKIEQAVTQLAGLLSKKHDVPLGAIWVLDAGGLPRTDSGKLQRYKAQEMAQNQALPHLRQIRPSEVGAKSTEGEEEGEKKALVSARPTHALIGQEISKLLASELGAMNVQFDQPFVELGVSSMTVYTLVAELEKTFKITIDPMAFYDHPNINALATHLLRVIEGESAKKS